MINRNIGLLSLAELQSGERAVVRELRLDGMARRRFLDLGFVPGTEIEVGNTSPMSDPVAYHVRGTTIALRKQDARRIIVERSNGSEEGHD
jgi:ferrous iron transport protein A